MDCLLQWRLPALGVFALLPANAPDNGQTAHFVGSIAAADPENKADAARAR